MDGPRTAAKSSGLIQGKALVDWFKVTPKQVRRWPENGCL
jgi:hypothetical protein